MASELSPCAAQARRRLVIFQWPGAALFLPCWRCHTGSRTTPRNRLAMRMPGKSRHSNTKNPSSAFASARLPVARHGRRAPRRCSGGFSGEISGAPRAACSHLESCATSERRGGRLADSQTTVDAHPPVIAVPPRILVWAGLQWPVGANSFARWHSAWADEFAPTGPGQSLLKSTNGV